MEAAKICTAPTEIEEKGKYKINLFSQENNINIIVENLEQIDVANYQGSFSLEYFQNTNKFFKMYTEPSEIIELISSMKNGKLINIIFEEDKANIILDLTINLKTEKVTLELKKEEINQLETIKNLCKRIESLKKGEMSHLEKIKNLEQEIESLKKEIHNLKNKKETYIIKTKHNFGYVLGVDCKNDTPKEGNIVALFLNEGNNSQRWNMINNNDGTFSFLINNTNLAITAAQSKEGYVNGRRIIVSNFINGNNQKFCISKNEFATISSSEKKNFVLDLGGGKVYNKSVMQFWEHEKNNDNQLFVIEKIN